MILFLLPLNYSRKEGKCMKFMKPLKPKRMNLKSKFNTIPRQEDVFKKQEEQIRFRDMQIQEDLIKFCNFLQDNEAKKKRAETRLADERKMKESKEREIQELTQQLQDLQRHQQRLDKKGIHSQYASYILKKVRGLLGFHNQSLSRTVPRLIEHPRPICHSNQFEFQIS